MKKATLQIIFALILFSTYAQGQVVKDTLTPGDTLQVHEGDTLKDHCVLCAGNVHTFIYAPYYTQFKKQWPFLISASAVYAAGFILTSSNKPDPLTAEEVSKLDKNSINSFDRVSTGYWSKSAGTASDYVLFGITVLPAAFLTEHHTQVDILPLAIMAAEAYLFNYGVTTICKNLTHRTRPYVYNPDLPIETKLGSGGRESFFSGHTSQTAAATFLFANVIRDYHPNMKPGIKTGMWVFAAAVPAVEAYLRVRAGKHYPSDVIAGYVIGAASGWAIPRLHRYQRSRTNKNKVDMGFLPYKDGMMMNLGYRF
jgi:membrane-associated phospholipid phosphatase